MERVKYTTSDVNSLKNQLRPPIPFTQTNALEHQQQQQQHGGLMTAADWMRSASSSESINSQEGTYDFELSNRSPFLQLKSILKSIS